MPGRLTETTLFVLANPDCPHCVHAMDTMTDWAVEEHIPVAGVDVRHHPQIEDAWALESSPVLVFRGTHGEHVHVGMPDRASFTELAHR